MKTKFIKIFCCVMALLTLCSCDTTRVRRTFITKNKITQKTVVKKSNAIDQKQYNNFFADFKKSFTIPGLYEGIIPQGFCFDENTGYFLITGYYEKEKFPSMVMAVDSKNGKFVGAYPLKTINGEDFYGHVGGIGTSQNTIYIASDYECYTIPINALYGVRDGDELSFNGKFKVNSTASFLTIHNNTLWIGDFIRSRDKEREEVEYVFTLPSGETFYAFCEGYILEDGLPSVNKINSDSTGYIPDMILAIPEQAQGIAFTKTDKIVFSTSYGRKKDSKLYIYEDVLIGEKSGTRKIDGVDVDLFTCDTERLLEEITAPPMAEDMAIHPDAIYIHFESGAHKYRNGGGKFSLDSAYKTTIE